ncbi:MAG: efflux RND transporter periplasmic adaptor subunit [Ideonella sp.]|nr:efflux RND transporter periplasmic adaptor subunit [Ideonella sp.]MCC7456490.1 efflux RND transporter periplasmic adaptor subunit [Nitrospira sp.]
MNARTTRFIVAAALLAAGLAAGYGIAAWRVAPPWQGVRDAHGAQAASSSAATASAPAERKVLYWYDPMVPTQRFDKPGKSPFMDMQLVPRYADEGEASGAGGVAVSPQAVQSLGVRLATVQRKSVGAAIDAAATVQLNERDVAIVQARSAGFVERVPPRAPGDVIAAGATLAEVFVPEWLAAQQEYLAVKRSGDAALAQAARARLALLGMPPALVAQADAAGQPVRLHAITAPIGGVISELAVRQGMTLAPGATLARINGLATVWLEVALPEALGAAIAPGQPAEARFPARPGQVVHGKVAAILPEANRDTRTLRVRIELPNPGLALRAGVFAQVRLRGTQREALVLPAESVIRTGRRALVYVVEAPGRYRPQEVQLGEQFDELIVVREGLAAGQQVVASGQFLIDSEASLRGVMARAAASAATGTAPIAQPAAAVHEARGVVVEIERDSITLDHEPVPALKWPAMVMPFKLASPQLAHGLRKGERVRFGFTQRGDDAVLVRVAPEATPAPASGAPR